MSEASKSRRGDRDVAKALTLMEASAALTGPSPEGSDRYGGAKAATARGAVGRARGSNPGLRAPTSRAKTHRQDPPDQG
eukprot:3799433-Alexandrium_andersonii.AAC.1